MMVNLMKDNAVKKDKEKESNAVKKTAMKTATKTAMKVMKAQKNKKAMMKWMDSSGDDVKLFHGEDLIAKIYDTETTDLTQSGDYLI